MAADTTDEPTAAPMIGGITTYTMADAAVLKGVGYQTVARAVASGRLPARRLGRMVLIDAADLQAWSPMRSRAPHRYRREPSTAVAPKAADLVSQEQIDLALQLAMFYELLQTEVLDLSLEDFAALAVERIARFTGMPRLQVWMIDFRSQEIICLAHLGADSLQVPGSVPLAAAAFFPNQGGAPDLSLDQAAIFPASVWREHPAFIDFRGAPEILVAPMRSGETVYGYIIGGDGGGPIDLSADQLALIQVVTNQVALAVDRSLAEPAGYPHHAMYEIVFEAMADVTIGVNVDGTINDLNHAARKRFPELEIGQAFAEVTASMLFRDPDGNRIPLDDMPLFHALNGETTRERLVQIRSADGEIVVLEITALPIYNGRSELTSAISIARDVTAHYFVSLPLGREGRGSSLVPLTTFWGQLGDPNWGMLILARGTGDLLFINQMAKDRLGQPLAPAIVSVLQAVVGKPLEPPALVNRMIALGDRYVTIDRELGDGSVDRLQVEARPIPGGLFVRLGEPPVDGAPAAR